ncbi:MAG: hypothetical protein LBM25_04010 [Bacteroidales bacterium]|jgi:hypothetical protein|nr:hypothetical protein [Bacteroidales bacterium]
MNKNTKILFWIVAIILTALLSIYQRQTGPTIAKKVKISLDNQEYNLKFPRSLTIGENTITLNIKDTTINAKFFYKRYPTNESFAYLNFERNSNGELFLEVPPQKKAGKIQYYIEINDKTLFENDPLVLRFKGYVPPAIIIPHIIFMFLSMLFALYGLLLAIFNLKNIKKYIILTLISIIIGGFIFGPLLQNYAFGVYWSGFPFGGDLTDNKTLLVLVLLLANLPFLNKKILRITSIITFIIMILIFTIPHSLKGSQLNYKTQQIESSANLQQAFIYPNGSMVLQLHILNPIGK